MNNAVRTPIKSNTFYSSKSLYRFREKKVKVINFKSYQKFFVVLISLSIFLIFPESPHELENICQLHNSRELCHVW